MTVGDVASIVSIVLAGVAIALSITFFRMSSQLSEEAKNAAQRIGASVDRLEKLFDKLYSDTFSLMRDTYQDMRKHAWPEEAKVSGELMTEAEKKTDEKLNVLKENLAMQLDQVLGKQMRTEKEVAKVKTDVQELVGRAISESRKVEEEALEETIREYAIRTIEKLAEPGEPVTAEKLVESLESRFKFKSILNELERMKDDGIISYKDKRLQPQTRIQLAKS